LYSLSKNLDLSLNIFLMGKGKVILLKINNIINVNISIYCCLIYIFIFTAFTANSQSLEYISNRMSNMANGEVMVRNAYNEVTSLKLKNVNNISKYKTFVSTKTITFNVHQRVKRKIVSHQSTYFLVGQFSTYINTLDLSDYDMASYVRNQFELILNDPTIKKEQQIAEAILNEISAIKYAHPNNYYNMERYNEMLSAMKYLKSCELDSLDEILFKYKLY
jgi:hypothetical protein